MTNQNFAELLTSTRSAADINVSELAEQILIYRKQIYRYERGEKVPYDSRLLMICEALGIDVNAATAARAVSIQQDADRGKSNATTRSIAAAYARSCRKRREPVQTKKHIGFCPCFGVSFSSTASYGKKQAGRAELQAEHQVAFAAHRLTATYFVAHGFYFVSHKILIDSQGDAMSMFTVKADRKTQFAICKSIRRARVLLCDKFAPCEHTGTCPIQGMVCAARDERLRLNKEWLANNCNAIKPTIKDEEMGIL
jgi:transcriptional regulator with XRE-family HTH domain